MVQQKDFPQSAAPRFVYWADRDKKRIRRSSLDGSSVEDLITSGLRAPQSLCLDVAGSWMYWIDIKAKRIQSVRLDGLHLKNLVTRGLRSPWGLTLDPPGDRMYWTDKKAKKIQCADLKGSQVCDLITGLREPSGIALDTRTGRLYWSDGASVESCRIQCARVDGSQIETVISTDLWGWPKGICVDALRGKIYWVSERWITGKVCRANLDGSVIEELIAKKWITPEWVTLDSSANKIYWTDSVTGKIRRMNDDGSGAEVIGEVSGASGIALDAIAPQPERPSPSLSPQPAIEAVSVATPPIQDEPAVSEQPRDREAEPAPSVVPKHFYWTGQGGIWRREIHAGMVENLVADQGEPTSLLVDQSGGRMYWIDESIPAIRSANLDGSDVTDMVTNGSGKNSLENREKVLRRPWDLALDTRQGCIFWTDMEGRSIRRASLDGSNIQMVVEEGLRAPMGIALDPLKARIYWTDGCDERSVGRILGANLDGSGIVEIVTDVLFSENVVIKFLAKKHPLLWRLENPSAIALDPMLGELYWVDAPYVYRSSLDGSDIEEMDLESHAIDDFEEEPDIQELDEFVLHGNLALDLWHRKLYRSDEGCLCRANLNGTHNRKLFLVGMCIALDGTLPDVPEIRPPRRRRLPGIPGRLPPGAEPHWQDADGHTALHEVARTGKLASMEALLIRGASPHAQDERDRSPLHAAAAAAQAEAATALLQAGADPDLRDYGGRTPLHLAADALDSNRGLKTIRQLLEAGANRRARDKFGLCPLHYLSGEEGSDEYATQASELLSDPSPTANPFPWNSREFFRAASAEEMVECLRGGVGEYLDRLGPRPLPSVLEDWPLNNAVRLRAKPEVVKAMLKGGANPDTRSVERKDGRSPLYIAVEQGDLPLIQTLLAAGADPKLPNETYEHTHTYVPNPDPTRDFQSRETEWITENKMYAGRTPLFLAELRCARTAKKAPPGTSVAEPTAGALESGQLDYCALVRLLESATKES